MGKPGKTESHAMTYLDMWRSSTFLLYGCKVAFCIQETSPRLSGVKHSVILWSLFVISSALTCCFSRNVPTLLHIVQVRFARPSPTLVLQAKNAGMRRLEYEPTETDHVFLLVSKSKILRATAILSLRTLCSAQ